MAETKELNLYQKLATIGGEIGIISKSGKNQEQGYGFIEYATVAGKLRTLFAKYGIVIVPYMTRSGHQHREKITSKYGKTGEAVLIDFTFVVINADKPTEKFSVTWTGEAADYGDKATNKAATSAMKYYLMRQFNVSEQGEDPDADSPERIEAKPGTDTQAPKKAPKPAVGSQAAPTPELASPAQRNMIKLQLERREILPENMAAVLAVEYGIADSKKMTKVEATSIIEDLLKRAKEDAA